MSTLDQINSIKERLEAITPGQWHTRGHDRQNMQTFVEAPEGERAGKKFGYDIEILGEDDNGYPCREADCVFIANAPDDIKTLLKIIEGME
jgi:tetrahydromethanopterin S-methyltransferase subunit G